MSVTKYSHSCSALYLKKIAHYNKPKAPRDNILIKFGTLQCLSWNQGKLAQRFWWLICLSFIWEQSTNKEQDQNLGSMRPAETCYLNDLNKIFKKLHSPTRSQNLTVSSACICTVRGPILKPCLKPNTKAQSDIKTTAQVYHQALPSLCDRCYLTKTG